MFQIICLNKNRDAVSVFRVAAGSVAQAKEQVKLRFAFLGAPMGAVTFRVVPLD
jgi:hypothetical protein